MMLEIYLFETIECLWINVFVPSLVSTEVQRVNNLLLSIINDLCTKASLGQKLVDSSQPGAYSLDVPSFLYTSTRVANAHPTLMESMIIRSYHTHLPGELARKWSKSYNQEHSGKTYKGGLCGEKVGHMRHTNSVSWPIAAIGSLLLTLQFAAMTPFEFQKMIIRFIQPFLYGGLVLLGQDIIKSPIYIVITAVILFTIAGYLLYQYYKYEINNENDNRNMAKIAPIPIAEEDHEKSSFGSKGSGGIMAGSHDDAALKKEKEDRFRRKEAKAKLHQKVRKEFVCVLFVVSFSNVSVFLCFFFFHSVFLVVFSFFCVFLPLCLLFCSFLRRKHGLSLKVKVLVRTMRIMMMIMIVKKVKKKEIFVLLKQPMMEIIMDMDMATRLIIKKEQVVRKELTLKARNMQTNILLILLVVILVRKMVRNNRLNDLFNIIVVVMAMVNPVVKKKVLNLVRFTFLLRKILRS
jgi:hypothetical protein